MTVMKLIEEEKMNSEIFGKLYQEGLTKTDQYRLLTLARAYRETIFNLSNRIDELFDNAVNQTVEINELNEQVDYWQSMYYEAQERIEYYEEGDKDNE